MKRPFYSSISAREAYGQHQQRKLEQIDDLDTFNVDDLVKSFTEAEPTNESTSAGHLKMRQERHLLNYLRLIELGVPELVGT
jgi:hypothetical protein